MIIDQSQLKDAVECQKKLEQFLPEAVKVKIDEG